MYTSGLSPCVSGSHGQKTCRPALRDLRTCIESQSVATWAVLFQSESDVGRTHVSMHPFCSWLCSWPQEVAIYTVKSLSFKLVGNFQLKGNMKVYYIYNQMGYLDMLIYN